MLSWNQPGVRRRARPFKRWDDELNAFFEERAEFGVGQWKHVAQHRATWANVEDDFVHGRWRR